MDIGPLLGYSCILGTLTVQAPGLTRLNLPDLEWIGGGLVIAFNTTLEQVSFDKLEEVKGSVDISNNGALTSMAGFTKLSSLGTVFESEAMMLWPV